MNFPGKESFAVDPVTGLSMIVSAPEVPPLRPELLETCSMCGRLATTVIAQPCCSACAICRYGSPTNFTVEASWPESPPYVNYVSLSERDPSALSSAIERAVKLILEHTEPWRRNEATVLDRSPYVADRLYYKNPFGDVADGVRDSWLTQGLGALAQSFVGRPQ